MLKNIVIFGEPATGKSTIAKKLSFKLPNYKIVESSEGLIVPIARHFKKLPSNYNTLLYSLEKIVDKNLATQAPINRKKARKIFSSLVKQYFPSFIAETLEKIYSKKYPTAPLIFTGVRGYENAKYFKKRGYFVVFLKANKEDLLERLSKKRDYSKKEILNELKEEDRLYLTKKIEKEADLVFNTSTISAAEIADKIISLVQKKIQECKKCINTNQNPFIKFNKEGYCDVCEIYLKNFDKKALAKELALFKSFVGSGKGKYDIMVGLSGGKDSSATLYQVREMGFTPLAFTFDLGYFHPYIYRRAKKVAEMCGVDYEIIPVRKYITKKMLRRFRKMADLYKRDKKEEFVMDYATGRREYQGVVRPCWVCRELIIHARYFEALKHGVRAVAIGINEWTSLKQSTSQKKLVVSAIRKLKPFPDKPAVYIVHFPFLIQAKLKDTKKILKKIGWNYYHNVQSNAASCLLACAAEEPLCKNLGFHPDTTRLAREVTVGFLTKKEAKRALQRIRKCKYSVPQILKKAELI